MHAKNQVIPSEKLAKLLVAAKVSPALFHEIYRTSLVAMN